MISICRVVATIRYNYLRRWWIGKNLPFDNHPDQTYVWWLLTFWFSGRVRNKECLRYTAVSLRRSLIEGLCHHHLHHHTQHHCHHGLQAALVAQERNISQLLKLAHPNVIWAMDPKVSLTWRARSLGAEFSSHTLILTMSGKILGEKNIYLLCQE